MLLSCCMPRKNIIFSFITLVQIKILNLFRDHFTFTTEICIYFVLLLSSSSSLAIAASKSNIRHDKILESVSKREKERGHIKLFLMLNWMEARHGREASSSSLALYKYVCDKILRKLWASLCGRYGNGR